MTYEGRDPPPAEEGAGGVAEESRAAGHASNSVEVGVSVRFVPWGIVRDGAFWTLRGTLVLAPVGGVAKGSAPTAFKGAMVPLADWPSQIQGLLRGAKLLVSPVKEVREGQPRARPALGSALDPDITLLRPRNDAEMLKVTRLWDALMAPDGDRDWHALSAALTPPAASLVRRTGRDPANGSPPKDGKIPDILPTGRGEMGLLLSLERGRSALERLRDPEDSCHPPQGSSPLIRRWERLRTRRAAKPEKGQLGWPSWLEDRARPVRLALAGGPDAVDPASFVAPAGETPPPPPPSHDERLNMGLIPERLGTDGQAQSRRGYTKAATAKDVKTGLGKLAIGRSACSAPAGNVACVANGSDADMEGAINRTRLLHEASSRIDPASAGAPAGCKALTGEDAAKNRFFAIQSQPALARLFNLALDVEIRDFKPSDDWAPLDDINGAGKAHFAFVAAKLGKVGADQRLVWTTAKFRLPAERPKDAHFWACTREELDACAVGIPPSDILKLSLASHVDGVLDLGAVTLQEDGLCNPRFDILSLDVQRVTENDMHLEESRREMQSVVTPAGRLSSGGLLLVDRWRQYQALAQAVSTLDRDPNEPPVVDAEDLTIGYKLDVGFDPGQNNDAKPDAIPTVIWRSLMSRNIAFSRSGFDVDSLIGKVLPPWVEPHELNAALLTFPSRIRENGPGEGVVAKADGSAPVALPSRTAYVEEVAAQWKGPPLGVDLEAADVVRLDKACPKPGELSGTGLLQLSQTHSLPKLRPDERPPLLRFGWAYRFGVRPTLAGGVSMSLKQAGHAYNATYDGRLALPAVRQKTSGRRALRHEAIQAPVVATPEAILTRKVEGPQETSLELVVRSRTIVTKDEAKAAAGEAGSSVYAATRKVTGPRTTHRIVIPPVVALDFADRHGVFDGAIALEKGPKGHGRPRGGLRNIDFDQEQVGGFPIWSVQRFSEGGEYPGKDPHAGPAAGPLPEPTGDAMFRPSRGADPAKRRLPYYPDPAADYMVFRIRHRDGRNVEGDSLVVPIRPDDVSYPDVRPIAVEVVAMEARSGERPTQERVLRLDAENGKPAVVAVDGGETIGGSGPVRATRVQVLLEPGESFDLDMWCLPSETNLGDWFDVVESAALVAGAFGRDGSTCASDTEFIGNLESFLGRPLTDIERTIRRPSTGGAGTTACSAGQLPLPGEAAIKCLTRLLWQAARNTLFPEICARTTLGVTHALDRPLEAPRRVRQIGEDGKERVGLTVLRVDQGTRRAVLDPKEDKSALRDAADWTLVGTVPGGTDVLIGGVVGLDRATASFLEVRATGPSLLSSAFDDPARGRSEDDRARGIWPDDPRPDASGRKMRAPLRVFGFEVDAHGCVTLPEERAILLRLDDIDPRHEAAAPRPGTCKPAPAPADRRTCDLLEEQRRSRSLLPENDPATGSPPAPQEVAFGTSYPDRISDTKARVLRFELLAGSRSSALIHDPQGRSLAPGEQTRSSHETDPRARPGRARLGLLPDPLPVALPASKAPARLSPLTLLPLFELRRSKPVVQGLTTTFEARRVARLRLRVRRPWFSSGAGERLGVVLWPPEMFDNGAASLPVDSRDDDHALRPHDTEPGYERMNMRGYADLDLGPGGAFVSRWGGDPTQTRHPESWLISTQVFGDLPQPVPPRGQRCPWTPVDPDADDVEVVYVPRATMPIPVDEGETTPGGEAGRPPATIEVALLAYKPRFDIDREHWYFDLKIDPHVAIEPFVRLGLVRYQGNAPRELRVSEPVVEWAQLLPERRVRVTTRGSRVTVLVEGHGSDLPYERQGDELTSNLHFRHGPRMRIAIHRRGPNGVESIAELEAPPGPGQSGMPPMASEEMGPTGKGALGSCWRTVFDLKEDPMKPPESGTVFSVVVEEVALMHPATYREEPFDKDGKDDELAETGPRFAARIEMSHRPVQPPPADRDAIVMHEYRD